MAIKTVLFDLDNTLMDFIKMKTESCKSALDAMIEAGLIIDKKTGLKQLIETYFRVGIESNIAFTEFLREQVGTVDKKILQSGIDAYLKRKPDFVKPYPYVLETLEFLKGNRIKIGMVTDAPREKAMYRLENLGITKFFEVIITYDDSKTKKPDELPFKLAIEKLDIEPSETLFVGDSIERDIEGAKRLGMKTLLIREPSDLKKIKSLLFK